MMNYDDKHLLNIQTASGKITKKLLEGVSNDVISPISIYRLLMILSEVTAGETKEQVDRLIGEKRIDPLAMKNLFEVDKDETVCKLADSIWVNPVFDIEQEKLDELHNLYDADVYSVPIHRNNDHFPKTSFNVFKFNVTNRQERTICCSHGICTLIKL